MSIIGVSDELHETLYETLHADAALEALVGDRIHQEVPQGTAYPYVQIGETFETKDATLGMDGRSVLVWIHVWSQYRGDSQAWAIVKRIGELLDQQALEVDGAVIASIAVEAAQVTRDPDGLTRHGKLDLRVRLSAT